MAAPTREGGGSVSRQVLSNGCYTGAGRLLGLAVASLLAEPAALAHHGVGNFAMDEDITLSGVVTKMDFVNPPSWVPFDATKPDATKAEYRCELRSAKTLRPSGWTP